MQFAKVGPPGAEKCDCNIGVAQYGGIVFTDYGLNLGDVIAGEVTCKLAGWTTCSCIPNDNNNYGIIDDWDFIARQPPDYSVNESIVVDTD